jgi:hypothetical protein
VDPRAQIVLARHAPQGVTLRNYQDFSLFDLWAEIAKLPAIRTEVKAEAASATGTDSRTPKVSLPVSPRDGRKCGKHGRSWPHGDKEVARVETHKDPTKTGVSDPETNSGRQDLKAMSALP